MIPNRKGKCSGYKMYALRLTSVRNVKSITNFRDHKARIYNLQPAYFKL